MRIGRLRETILIERKTNEQDSYGAEVESYITYFKAKADVKYLSGIDLIQAGLATNVEAITVLIRFDERLSFNCFLSTKGSRFNVVGIRPDNKSRNMIITATREV